MYRLNSATRNRPAAKPPTQFLRTKSVLPPVAAKRVAVEKFSAHMTTTGFWYSRQAIYDEPLHWDEARDCDWLTEPPVDPVQRRQEEQWLRVREAKRQMDEEFRRVEGLRLAQVMREIDEDRRKEKLNQMLEERNADLDKNAEETQQHVRALEAAIKLQNDIAWRKQATARLRNATKRINAEIVARERRLYGRHT
jgi:hypothetical protein